MSTDAFDNKAVTATFIILSYLRPQNIGRILSAIHQSRSCGRIILSNNNPKIDIQPYVDTTMQKLEIVNQTERWEAVARFCIARETPGRYFVCIDDDLFLTPMQIDALVGRLAADPSVPHGIWGERHGVYIDAAGEERLKLEAGLCNFSGEIDVINRAYAFTAQHVERFFELMAAMGIDDPRKLGRCDDILLSYSGSGRPRCHDLGPLEDCPTSNTEGIALWREPGFFDLRIQRLLQLKRLLGDR
jgi:hypothetical protein